MMTLEDLADHMRRVRLGEAPPASEDEASPVAVERWEELLRRLATPVKASPLPVLVSARCPACESARIGRLDLSETATHVGCYYA